MLSNNILLQLFIIYTHSININRATSCDFSFCNFEGECKQDICQCIGDQYFKGPKCQEIVNHCNENPCENNGVCKNFVGQHICENCANGYGGDNCQERLSNLFTKMMLHFQHYAYYGEVHQFLIIVETLGQVAFTLELKADNYAIALIEVTPTNSTNVQRKWHKTNNLKSIFNNLKLRHSNHLPYTQGYYHVAQQIFWTQGLQQLTLTVYDTETASKRIFLNNYELLIVQQPQSPMGCIPKLEFLYGVQPHRPLYVDLARYNNFEAIIKERCNPNSKFSYEWKFFDSIGSKLLHNFGRTHLPQLKVPPYSLWFNYHGEAYLSYRFELEITETYGKSITALTKERCFIQLMRKPLNAIIVGGDERNVGFGQAFTLDGTQSRDYALSAKVKQDIIYEWSCSSDDDPNNSYCKQFKSTASKLSMKSNGRKRFLLDKSYTFNLTIYSRINLYGSDTTYQKITITKEPTLSLKIICIRNCMRNSFSKDHIIHLKVASAEEYINLGLKSSKATITWTNDKHEELGNEHRLIYMAPDTPYHKIWVTVKYKDRIGKANINITLNEPPSEGNCSITPSQGIAYETKFNITCADYWDADQPLTYEFTNDNFTLARSTYSNLINVPLPPTESIHIRICDELFACTSSELTVSVGPLPQADNYLLKHKNILSQLLLEGNTRSSLILAMALARNLENTKTAELLIDQIKDFNFETLVNVEQIITIAQVLCQNLLPLDHKKARIFAKLFAMLKKAFIHIIEDGEIEDMLPHTYERCTEELLQITNEISKMWEEMPIVERLETQIVTRNNPLAEMYLELPDFDITALERINHWLHMSIEFNKCLDLLGLTSAAMHFPTEEPLLYENAPCIIKNYAIDLTVIEEDIYINETSYAIRFTKECLLGIKDALTTDEIVIQSIEIKDDNNPFWWYPDNYGIQTDYIYFSIYAVNTYRRQTTTTTTTTTKIPFEMILPLKNPLTEPEESKILTSYLISHLHMPIFKAAIPENSILMVKFLNASIDLRILVKCGKPPRSYETENSSFIVAAKKQYATQNQKFMIHNFVNQEKYAYMAVLSKERTNIINNEKMNFSFIMEIQQCLRWDFTLKDPQWSTTGCQAIIHSDTDNVIKCHCTHFSIYSGKAHAVLPAEDLRDDHILLENLLTNWLLVFIYLAILIVCFIILLYVRYKHSYYQCPVLRTNLNHDVYDIEVFLITGNMRNAGSTANITFQFMSTKGLYVVTVYQPKSLLKQNSICKFFISSIYIGFPFKLCITNDQQGRHSSWYCKQIIINIWKKQQYYTYNIEKWITTEPIEFQSVESVQKWPQTYYYNLSLLYTNWYEFQSFMGPELYVGLPRDMRTYIWILQLLLTCFIVSIYHGPTTMKTYEEEREIYHTMYIHTYDIILLCCCCYIINILLCIVFYICIYVQQKLLNY